MCGTPDVMLQMTGYEKLYKNIMVVAVFINISLNLILIPKFGSVGAAIASLIGLSFWNIASVVYVKKMVGIHILSIPFMSKSNKSY